MDFLSPIRRKSNYSVDRLRVLYTDLIQHIDVSNEDLGRRAINEEDVLFHKKSMRFTFRRKLIPDNNTPTDPPDFESRDTPSEIENMSLLAAFRMLAAIKSPDKEGNTIGAVRDDCSAAALSSAKRIESRVVELIKDIGEVVVNTERATTHVRGDPVFEYFCEKSMLSLLVDIAKEKRQRDYNIADSSVHGVVWSPLVKAQCFETASQLISDVGNSSVLYYLFSQNYINELIRSMLPFRQWTDSALSKMMPAYVDLLKNATVQLTKYPNLFPFLTMEDDDETGETNFPLFSATLELMMSNFAQSDSEIYGTCLDVIITLMKVKIYPVHSWIISSSGEQRKLADHLCQRLLDRYDRTSDLCTGPVVDVCRSKAISGQLVELADHLGVIQEVFWSRVRGLDVRLCESLLQRVVSVLLNNLLPPRPGESFLEVGVVDMDVIPQREARAQVSSIFLAYLFSNLTYTPFQRMLAVAVLHPLSTPLWLSSGNTEEATDEEYLFMPALSDIVTGEKPSEAYPNQFRAEIIKGLQGDYGDWRFISCACLVQSILDLDMIETEDLAVLKILPEIDPDHGYLASPLEEALSGFFDKEHLPSRIAIDALECAGHLAIQMIYFAVKNCNVHDDITDTFDFVLEHSTVWNGLMKARNFFSAEAIKFKETTGVSDILLDLIEAAVCNRYVPRQDDSGDGRRFACSLHKRGCAEKLEGSEMLVRKSRDYGMNDIETARFFINMALHYGALYKVVDHKLRLSVKVDQKQANLDLIDEADFLTRTVGGLLEKPKIGTDIDLTGRMVFRFHLALKPDSTSPEKSAKTKAWRRKMSSDLMVVLDPTDIFIVTPIRGQVEENRSTMLCSISLRSVIAAASDEEWLHVAARHDDVDLLIKNGNMALQFENPGASLIVKNYLDRSREVLRQELMVKVTELLTR